MKNVQDGLCVKNLPCMVKNDICGRLESNDLTKEQERKYISSKTEINKSLKN